jgi:cbb3-type cytochrome oxidase subunit 3
MTDSPAPAPRPVSFVLALAIMACFGFFVALMYFFYRPHKGAAPEYGSAEKLPDDLQWTASAGGRKAYLTELRGRQEKQATTYAWVDQKAGVVQLPIDRAMELVVQEYNQKK